MKTRTLLLSILFFVITALQSCAAIGDIFKTGMGVGIFLVVIVIIIIIVIVAAVMKK
jgi:hypothetical protein